MPKPCYIFDLDGTLCDLSHRLHHIQKAPKDWDAFFAEVHLDMVIPHMKDLFFELSERNTVIVVSGRNEVCKHETMDWLTSHGIFPDAIYMRRKNDRRQDYHVKKDLLTQILAEWRETMLHMIQVTFTHKVNRSGPLYADARWLCFVAYLSHAKHLRFMSK